MPEHTLGGIYRLETHQEKRDQQALRLLTWLHEHYPGARFERIEVLDVLAPQDEMCAEKIALYEADEQKRVAGFAWLLKSGYILPMRSLHHDHMVTPLGAVRVAELTYQRMARLCRQRLPTPADSIQWDALGGKPFCIDRNESEYAEDMLLSVVYRSGTPCTNFNKDELVGVSQKRIDDEAAHCSAVHRLRSTFGTLLQHLIKMDLLEVVDEDVFRISEAGNIQALEMGS